jgi:tetratricopeptide (TPR) repeat protein
MSTWVGPEILPDATNLAERAVQLDPRDPQCHFALGLAHHHSGQVRSALAATKEAIRLNPSHAAAYVNQAFLLNYLNRPEDGLESVSTAIRLSPHDMRRFLWATALTGGYYLSERFEQAIDAGLTGLRMKSDYLRSMPYIVAALGQLGRSSEAERYMPMLREIYPTADHLRATLGRYYLERAALSNVMQGLRKAGFR